MAERPRVNPGLVMAVSVVAVSTASILIRMTAAPPLAIGAWRLALSTAMLLPFFFASGGPGKLGALGGRDRLLLASVGFVLAVHFAAWITSLGFTSVASSVVFVHVDPVFVALVSHYLLGEKVGRRQAAGIAVAFLGASVIAFGDLRAGEVNLIGDALSLVGAVALGLYLMAGRRIRQRLDLTTYVTPVYAVSAFFLSVGAVATGTPLLGYPTGVYVLFLLLALVPMIFGHTLYNWALRWVPATVVSLSLLGEPVGASLLAYLVLGEAPPALTLVGGAVTLTGIFICTSADNG